MEVRRYDSDRDAEAMLRIYADVGWHDDSARQASAIERYHEGGSTWVALIDGRAESFASNHDGTLAHRDTPLPLVVVGGVGTSHIARRGGIATRVTAEAIAGDVLDKGAAVAVLGVFDHGFYDRIGFGAGAYDRLVAFDPGALRVPALTRAPVRLGLDDFERIHANRLARPLRHGAVRLSDPQQTHADMLTTKDPIGLGFEDEQGKLTHHVWLHTFDRRNGPWQVKWLGYEDPTQVLELLSLLKRSAEQVSCVRMIEPPEIRIWDLLVRPYRTQQLTRGGSHEASVRASPWWAARMCDVPACLAATDLGGGETVRFNLVLTDPIREWLTPETAKRWPGVAGSYLVTLGAASDAEPGASDATLPTLRTSVGTFTRLWLGVQEARGLAVTAPDLDAPAALLESLDRVLRLPMPELGWDL